MGMHPDEILRLRAEVRAITMAEFQGESGAHDLFHLDRVWENARQIHESDELGDVAAITAAAYLHDLHRHLERVAGHHVSAMDCDDFALQLLRRMPLPASLEEEVLDAIHYTEYYSFGVPRQSPRFVTSVVVRDADNLDAMGAIGVARAFTYGGRIGEPIWDGCDVKNVGLYRSGVTHSVVHHFHEKLLRLQSELETPTGREMGMRRHLFMVQFLETLRDEWTGR